MIDYEGRRFRPEEGGGTEATYHQDGDIIWAESSGGAVKRGALTGICRPDGTLLFGYTRVMADGTLIVGSCTSTPTLLDDGRVVLNEQWERYLPVASAGVSRIVETR
jgi:hypothetical protein